MSEGIIESEKKEGRNGLSLSLSFLIHSLLFDAIPNDAWVAYVGMHAYLRTYVHAR